MTRIVLNILRTSSERLTTRDLIPLVQSCRALITPGAMIDSINEREPSFTVVVLVNLRKRMSLNNAYTAIDMDAPSAYPCDARR